MRASDSDRDRVAGALREHYAQGRLTVEEFDERLEQLYRSRTYGELAVLTKDLPDIDMRSYTPKEVRPAVRKDKSTNDLRDAWRAWAAVSGINWVVWLAVTSGSDGFVYPWPIWVMGPWGVIMLLVTIFGGGGRERGRDRHG